METLEARLHVLSTSPFFVSGTFDLFDITCKQHPKTALNPFLNGTNNGDVDGTYKQTIVVIGQFQFYTLFTCTTLGSTVQRRLAITHLSSGSNFTLFYVSQVPDRSRGSSV